MAGKTPGTPRKTGSRKTASKTTKSVTPISQGDMPEKAAEMMSQGDETLTGKTVASISKGNGKSAEVGKSSTAQSSSGISSGIYEEVRRRAYELYEERGRQHGFHHDDWSRAETEVLSRFEREKSA